MVAFKGTWSELELSSVMDLSSILLQKRDESGPTAPSAVERVRGKREMAFCSNMDTRFRVAKDCSGWCNAWNSLTATLARDLPGRLLERMRMAWGKEKEMMRAPVRRVSADGGRHACILSSSTRNNNQHTLVYY